MRKSAHTPEYAALVLQDTSEDAIRLQRQITWMENNRTLLTPDQRALIDKASRLMLDLRSAIQYAAKLTPNAFQ